jgi:GNAT superfamily N-acetyltransferase
VAVVITPYCDADFEPITSIWFESASTMGIPMPVTLQDLRERWPKEITAGWEIHVARHGSKSVGFMALKSDMVDQLFVAPGHQGQGIGKRLLDFAKIRFPEGFYLTVASAGRAQNFYLREGLSRGEVSRHRFGHEIVRYDWRPCT